MDVYVYFIRVGRYFKIGASRDPHQRFANLRKSGTRYTFPVDADASWLAGDRELYHVVEGWKDREHGIHIALDQFAVGLEWFLDEPPLRAFIDAIPVSEPAHYEEWEQVARDGGFCRDEYRAVQLGRGIRETARYYAGRSA